MLEGNFLLFDRRRCIVWPGVPQARIALRKTTRAPYADRSKVQVLPGLPGHDNTVTLSLMETTASATRGGGNVMEPLSRYWLLLGFFVVVCLSLPTHATTYTADSCSSSDVQTAFNSATHDGDIVTVPPGSCTWTSTVAPPCSSWTLEGSGAGSTNITVNNSGGNGIAISSCSGKSVRITGFTWTRQATAAEGMFHTTGGTGLSFRIDHNTLNSTGGWGRWAWFNVPCVAPGCVVDHNTITDVGIEIAAELSSDGGYAGCGGSPDNCAGLTQWNRPMVFDNGSEVYFENNTFSFDNYYDNDMLDCMNGGRYVFRYNTVTGNDIFNHGYDSVAESCLELTAYHNTITGGGGPGNYLTQANILYRGGTGLVYQNIMKYSYTGSIAVTNYRSNNSGYADIHTPYCGGGNPIDGNITNGRPCYEQIGRGSSSTAPGLASYPLYEWDNCKTALGCTGTNDQNTITVYNAISGWTIDNTTADIAQNRDFYDSVSSFNGTAGVGIGVLSSRPASCTTGVAYWAMDTTKLYQCSSPNNWTVYYTPYTYPHPLQGGGGGTAPAPPTGLTATIM
jgi:hypothetical protein